MKDTVSKLKNDLWVILLDAVVVNASYFLALLIRFFVGGVLRPVAVDRYLPAWISFTPIYSVLCLCVFGCFRLYGGIWRYAGLGDMNRIIAANICTSIIHVVGTVAFVERMPLTYYIIGGVLQFVGIALIRFSYRLLLVEKKRLGRGKKTDCVIVGSGENARRVLKHLQDSEVYRVTAIYGTSEVGSSMDGIPIKALSELVENTVVFIADPLLTKAQRDEIKANASDVIDYTGYISNLGGRLSLTELFSVIHGSVIISVDGVEKEYSSGAEALEEITGKYTVVEVTGKTILVKLEKTKKPSTEEILKSAYTAVIGES